MIKEPRRILGLFSKIKGKRPKNINMSPLKIY